MRKPKECRNGFSTSSSSRYIVAYFPVNKMDGSVCQLRQSFIVRHDDKSLPEAVAQIEEEPVELLLIVPRPRAVSLLPTTHSVYARHGRKAP